MLNIKQCLLKSIDNQYTISVLEKFCAFGLNENLPLEKRITHIQSMLSVLEKLQKLDKYPTALENMQNNLFTSAQREKNSTLLEVAIAMNTIIYELKKDLSKNNIFYQGIQSTIELMQQWRKKLQEEQKELNQLESKKRKGSTFFPNLEVSNKRHKVTDDKQHETKTAEDITNVSMNQKIY